MAAKKTISPKGGRENNGPSEGLRLVATHLVASGRTRSALEARLGVGNGYLSSLLRGRRRTPGARIMVRFRDVLRIPLDAWTKPAKGAVPEVPRLS